MAQTTHFPITVRNEGKRTIFLMLAGSLFSLTYAAFFYINGIMGGHIQNTRIIASAIVGILLFSIALTLFDEYALLKIYEDRLEKFNLLNRHVYTIFISAITEWEEHKTYSAKDKRERFVLSIYSGKMKITLLSSNCTDYEAVKSLLLRYSPPKKQTE